MKFTDTKGRDYECVVTLQTVINLRKNGVNLNDLFKKDSDIWTRLDNDPELLVNTLCVICDESIRKHHSGTDEEIAIAFASSIGGDTLAHANAAMWEAIASFYPPLQRAALMKIWIKTQSLTKLAMERIWDATDNLTLETLSKSGVGNLPGSRVG